MNIKSKYTHRYSIITIVTISFYMAFMFFLITYMVYCHVQHVDGSSLFSSNKTMEIVNGYERVDNPNPFNENCFLDETYNYSFMGNYFTSEALLFYEKTGLQIYYLCIDIENVDSITSNADVKEYALSKVIDFIGDDEYAVVMYETNGKYVYDDSGLTTYEHVISTYICNDEMYYGPKTYDIFDAQGRRIFSELLVNYYEYFSYDDYYSTEIGIFDKFLLYTGFLNEDVKSVENSVSYELKCDICKILIIVFTVIFVVVIIWIQKHKLHMIETVEILNCDISKDTDDLIDKYIDENHIE